MNTFPYAMPRKSCHFFQAQIETSDSSCLGHPPPHADLQRGLIRFVQAQKTDDRTRRLCPPIDQLAA